MHYRSFLESGINRHVPTLLFEGVALKLLYKRLEQTKRTLTRLNGLVDALYKAFVKVL